MNLFMFSFKCLDERAVLLALLGLLLQELLKGDLFNLFKHDLGLVLGGLVLALFVNLDLPEPVGAEDEGANLWHIALLRVVRVWLPLPHVHVAVEGARREDV